MGRGGSHVNSEQNFCFWTHAYQIWQACSPVQGLSKDAKKWAKVHRFRAKVDQSSNFDPQYLLPRGIWGQFLHRAIGGFSPYLSSKIGGPNPRPQFWRNFFRNFGVLQLRPLESRKRASGAPFFISPINYESNVVLKERKKLGVWPSDFLLGAPELSPPIILWFLTHNFFVFELWSTIFEGLVALSWGFLTNPKYLDQSSAISRKSGSKFKNWSLNNFFVFEHRPTKFWWLVALSEGFPKTSKYVDQSSPILRKSESSSKFDPL